MAGNGGQDIALVAHMLDLLQANDWRCVRREGETLRARHRDIPSTLRRILRAKTLSSSPLRGLDRRASQTLANVPNKAQA